MEKLFRLVFGLGGEVNAELAEGVGIDLGKNYGRVHFRVTELGQHLHSLFCIRVACGGDSKCDKHLVGMQTGVMVAEVFGFEGLNGREYLRGDDIFIVGDIRKSLYGVEKRGGRCTEQG